MLYPKANNFLKKADKDLGNRIREKLKTLGNNPESGVRLKYSDFWRLRIGNYRAIYEIDRLNNIIIILFIGHRKDVYDDFSQLL